jgi:hypothetical protein
VSGIAIVLKENCAMKPDNKELMTRRELLKGAALVAAAAFGGAALTGCDDKNVNNPPVTPPGTEQPQPPNTGVENPGGNNNTTVDETGTDSQGEIGKTRQTREDLLQLVKNFDPNNPNSARAQEEAIARALGLLESGAKDSTGVDRAMRGASWINKIFLFSQANPEGYIIEYVSAVDGEIHTTQSVDDEI